MVAAVLAAGLLSSATQQGDTATFRDAATAELYALARVRHIRQDSLVRDYRALVRTRMDVTVGRGRFARQTVLLVHETVAQITWRAPNDLKVQALGARSAAPIVRMVAGMRGEVEVRDELRQEVWLDRPWFIPRALGDSVRLMGVPERAALHPLGEGGTDEYRFAITDSVRLSVPGREVRAVRMRVEPKKLGPSLVAGDMWLDRETADVVRLVVVFVGEYLWDQPNGITPEDSTEARNDNKWANRFLSIEADIEYALVDNRYWLPHRQLLALTAEIPWFINVAMPARAVSTFSNYEVNTSPEINFAVPVKGDSAGSGRSRTRVRVKNVDDEYDDERRTSEERYRNGYYRGGTWSNGRWEVDVPPAESLVAYEWDSDFQVALDREEQARFRESLVWLANITEELPPEWVGRSRFQLAWEEVSDIFRFNRVQGPSVGLGYQIRPGPAFTTVLARAKFGFGDQRPTGAVAWRRDGPGGRFDLTAYRDVREVEPWTRGLGVGNSLNGIFTGHDDADYYLALGAGFSYSWNTGLLRDLEFGAYFERHRTMATEADAPIPDLWSTGNFPQNPRVAEGNFFRGSVSRVGAIGIAQLRQAADVLADGDLTAGRLWGSASIPYRIFGRTGTLMLRAGVLRGDSLPQLEFRVGGPQTVRGYTYGTRVDRQFWSAQLDFALARSPIWAPVVFLDIGDTFSSDPMVGAGTGLSLINGLVRFSLSLGLRPSTDLRFDLEFRAPR